MNESVTETIHKQILQQEAGNLFCVDDFRSCGSLDGVRQALTRLYKRNIVKRAAPGIYYVAKIDKWDGAELLPSVIDIARTIAKRAGTRIVPDGLTALNMLGISPQVPAKAAFITDGAPRKVKTESGTLLEFKHTSNMTWFKYKSDIMLLIVSAMREVGEHQLTPDDMKIISSHLASVSPADFDHDIKLAPIWVAKKLFATNATPLARLSEYI